MGIVIILFVFAYILLLFMIAHFTEKINCILENKEYPGFLRVILLNESKTGWQNLCWPLFNFTKYSTQILEKNRKKRNLVIFCFWLLIALMFIYYNFFATGNINISDNGL